MSSRLEPGQKPTLQAFSGPQHAPTLLLTMPPLHSPRPLAQRRMARRSSRRCLQGQWRLL